MLKTEIVLYILSRNKQDLKFYILSTDKDSISYPIGEVISNMTLKDNCYEIYKQYVRLSKDLLDFRLLDISITDHIEIICFTLIPFDLRTHDSYLLPISNNEISSSHLQKIINII